jgi:very-short-patch-repair endonuclease
MRREPTAAEDRLWRLLKDRRFAGFKFRRQVPVGPYIGDFVCYDARLIVEMDGSQHAESVRDRKRDAWLRADGYEIIRVWNNELTDNQLGVTEAIYAALVTRGREQ